MACVKAQTPTMMSMSAHYNGKINLQHATTTTIAIATAIPTTTATTTRKVKSHVANKVFEKALDSLRACESRVSRAFFSCAHQSVKSR